MAESTLPTPEEEQRTKWDLLLTDLEYRLEQLRHAKAYYPVDLEARLEELRHAKAYNPIEIEVRLAEINHAKTYNPIDIEARLEQLRQLKTIEPTRLWIQAITAAAAVFAAGGVVGGLIARLLSGH